MARLYLGVDAGNSKTVAVVCDERANAVGFGRSGNGDIYGAVSTDAAVDAVLTAVGEALRVAGSTPDRLAGAAFRLAGVDWPEDHTFWVDALRCRLPDTVPRSIANDGFAAIRCGEPSGVGVAVVGGTGPAVASRGRTGAEWSVGFWVQGRLGATGLVDDALRTVYSAAIGLGPSTALTEALLERFGQVDVERLLHAFTRRDGEPIRRERAAASRTVTAVALAGDPVAGEVVRRHGERFADYARVAAEQVGFDPNVDQLPVVLAGSVLLGRDSPVAEALLTALPERLPGALPRVAVVPPVCGAALDALAEAGVDITPAVVDQLRATAPPQEMLRT